MRELLERGTYRTLTGRIHVKTQIDFEYYFFHKVLDEIEMNEDIDLEKEEEEQTPIDNTAIIVNLRSLVKKIRKSVKLRQKLKKCCAIFGVDYPVPIINVKHRWMEAPMEHYVSHDQSGKIT